MKHRTLMLIIFLLLCASFTYAMPEGNQYENPDFFDEFGAYAIEGWNYIVPPLEPVVDALYDVAVNNGPSLHGGELQSTLPLPDGANAAYQDGYLDGQDFYNQSPLTAVSSYEYPPPIAVDQPPNPYPQMLTNASEGSSFPLLTAGTLGQIDAQSSVLRDEDMELWAQDTYIAGQRVEPIHQNAQAWMDFHQALQHPPILPAQTTSAAIPPQRTLLPALTPSQTLSPAPALRFPCNYPNCTYVGQREPDLRHHRRYHTPMSERPHPCPRCPARFLSPREVERHLPTHGLGRKYYCHVSGCAYARRGFGRKDHLTRHIRSRHGADSVMSNTETGSTVMDDVSSV